MRSSSHQARQEAHLQGQIQSVSAFQKYVPEQKNGSAASSGTYLSGQHGETDQDKYAIPKDSYGQSNQYNMQQMFNEPYRQTYVQYNQYPGEQNFYEK